MTDINIQNMEEEAGRKWVIIIRIHDDEDDDSTFIKCLLYGGNSDL